MDTNTAEDLTCGSKSEIATLNFESESDGEGYIEQLATDGSPDWLTCAGELSFLVENLKVASNLLEQVKGDNCPLIEVFLTNAAEISRNILRTANQVNKTCIVLLREMNKKKKEVSRDCASTPSHDPSDRSKLKTTSDRKFIMKLGPHQPKLPVFPRNEEIIVKKQCRFSSQWYNVYPHLEYSISQDAAFCFVCSLFPTGPGREMADNAWSSVGVRTWHKMISCGSNSKGKTGKFAKHFSSKAHKSALADFYSFNRDSSNVDMLLDKERRVNAIQEKEDSLANEGAACILLDVARTLGRQGLPFRGSSTHEHGEKDGNFYQIVQLVSRHCPSLKKWLSEARLRPYHVTYLSAESQNEMIAILGSCVRSKVRQDVKDSKMFSVMADTTPDTSKKDRLAVAVRYVKEDSSTFAVKERLLEIRETTEKTGIGQANDIIESLEENGLATSCLVFQSYDFASNMSGHCHGAQAEIERKLQRKIPYIACQAHRTNTVVEHACNSSPVIQELFNILQDLYVIFSGSTKRHAVLSHHFGPIENSLQLRNISKTRWTARSESIRAVWASLEAVLSSLEEVNNSTVEMKVKATASGLLKKVKSFDFIASLMFMKNIMLKTKFLSDELQREELNIIEALEMTKATIISLERIKGDETAMTSQITAATEYSKKLGIDAEADFAKHHRTRRPPRRLDEHPETTAVLDLYQFFGKEFKCVLDVLITEFKEKIQPTLDIIAPLSRLLQLPLQQALPTDIKAVAEMIPSNVDCEVLAAELEVFTKVPSQDELASGDRVIHFVYDHRAILPLTWKLYKLVLTAPISVAKDHETFSHLKFVKGVYRSTMADKRLDNLMILNCEKDLTDSLDIEDVLKIWASKPRR